MFLLGQWGVSPLFLVNVKNHYFSDTVPHFPTRWPHWAPPPSSALPEWDCSWPIQKYDSPTWYSTSVSSTVMLFKATAIYCECSTISIWYKLLNILLYMRLIYMFSTLKRLMVFGASSFFFYDIGSELKLNSCSVELLCWTFVGWIGTVYTFNFDVFQIA
jgi:hypothetical protein